MSSSPEPNALYWLLIAFGEGLNKKERLAILWKAKETVGSLEEFVDQGFPGLPGELREKVSDVFESAPTFSFLLREVLEQGIRVVPLADPAYPERLKRSLKADAPLVLFVLGEVGLLNAERALAIIGSRKASEPGLEVARRAGAYFGREGYVVVSGMAKGVDREAVEGALEAGGRAVGVLPFGMLSSRDILPLLRRFQEDLIGGRLALVSEFHPQRSWKAWLAMARNRVVVGLSDAVFVVESGLKESSGRDGKTHKSGTWDAVEKARKLGKRVFVADLPVEGNQELIRLGLGTPVSYQSQEGFWALEDQLQEAAAPMPNPTDNAEPSQEKKEGGPIQPPLFPEDELG